ncbi:unnamed protein product [Ranitomeya imitator]|uniref:Transmembrane protein 107 n=1 Tax=Ranitomeya imitator TaxID=111125 RepID=A0ABN9MM22_9NEOB|nr:unnamed protein product [Ranitomeya imitator]
MFTLVTRGPRHRWSLESCLCDSSPATTQRLTNDHGQVVSLVVIVGPGNGDWLLSNEERSGLRAGAMAVVSSLVPARFLTLTAHLVIVITIFWSRENNVLACLRPEHTQDQYKAADTELVALSVTLGMFVIELAGFFSGVSMFNNTQGVLCKCRGRHIVQRHYLSSSLSHTVAAFLDSLASAMVAHCSASVSLSLFVTQKWECATYWYIFGFCSALPAVTENHHLHRCLRIEAEALVML